MKELLELKNKLSTERPGDWESLPDIELYKDQVLGYMQRQHTIQGEEGRLTGAMINNYIKSGLLPRPNGKKYWKEHLAYLTAISTLKQVLTVGQTDFLLKQQPHILDSEHFYGEYMEKLNGALSETADGLDPELTVEQLASVALQLAVTSYAQKLACEEILEILKNHGKKPE